MQDIAINGLLPSWASVRVELLGRDLAGITAIDYEDGVTTKPVYGRGKKRIGRVQGMYEANASLTVEMTEIEALIQTLPAGATIYDIEPFDIPVSYVNDNNLLVSHLLKGCTFLKQNRGGKSGEVKEIESKLPLDVTEIDWNA